MSSVNLLWFLRKLNSAFLFSLLIFNLAVLCNLSTSAFEVLLSGVPRWSSIFCWFRKVRILSVSINFSWSFTDFIGIPIFLNIFPRPFLIEIQLQSFNFVIAANFESLSIHVRFGLPLEGNPISTWNILQGAHGVSAFLKGTFKGILIACVTLVYFIQELEIKNRIF